MKYVIKPEVPGMLGDDAIVDKTTRPISVTYLHYVFDDWLGDDIVQGLSAFMVTEELSSRLLQSKLTGFEITDFKLEKSDTFEELNPNITLPRFKRLLPTGDINSDFLINENGEMVISKSALDFLSDFVINNMIIFKYPT